MSGSLRLILLRWFYGVILVYLGTQIPDLIQSGKISHRFDGRNWVLVRLLTQIGMDLGINGLWSILHWFLGDGYSGGDARVLTPSMVNDLFFSYRIHHGYSELCFGWIYPDSRLCGIRSVGDIHGFIIRFTWDLHQISCRDFGGSVGFPFRLFKGKGTMALKGVRRSLSNGDDGDLDLMIVTDLRSKGKLRFEWIMVVSRGVPSLVFLGSTMIQSRCHHHLRSQTIGLIERPKTAFSQRSDGEGHWFLMVLLGLRFEILIDEGRFAVQPFGGLSWVQYKFAFCFLLIYFGRSSRSDVITVEEIWFCVLCSFFFPEYCIKIREVEQQLLGVEFQSDMFIWFMEIWFFHNSSICMIIIKAWARFLCDFVSFGRKCFVLWFVFLKKDRIEWEENIRWVYSKFPLNLSLLFRMQLQLQVLSSFVVTLYFLGCNGALGFKINNEFSVLILSKFSVYVTKHLNCGNLGSGILVTRVNGLFIWPRVVVEEHLVSAQLFANGPFDQFVEIALPPCVSRSIFDKVLGFMNPGKYWTLWDRNMLFLFSPFHKLFFGISLFRFIRIIGNETLMDGTKILVVLTYRGWTYADIGGKLRKADNPMTQETVKGQMVVLKPPKQTVVL